jgi:hypothetical protein
VIIPYTGAERQPHTSRRFSIVASRKICIQIRRRTKKRDSARLRALSVRQTSRLLENITHHLHPGPRNHRNQTATNLVSDSAGRCRGLRRSLAQSLPHPQHMRNCLLLSARSEQGGDSWALTARHGIVPRVPVLDLVSCFLHENPSAYHNGMSIIQAASSIAKSEDSSS